MKKVLWIVIVTSALVLGNQEVQKRGGKHPVQNRNPVTESSTDLAILKLMTATSPIVYPSASPFDLLSDACRYDMKKQCDYTNPGNGIRCDFIKTCYVAGMPSDFAIHIFSKTKNGEMPENPNLPPGSEQMANMGTRFQTIFLPFEPNHDTYTTLNPTVAPLFFTDDLGGCDMFVAIATNKGDKPIVFHTNRNGVPDPVQNLRAKGQSVDRILTKYPGYKVIARVHWTSLKPAKEEQIDKYLKTEYIPEHPGITLLPYNNRDGLPTVDHAEEKQHFSFIGHYKLRDASPVWKFILKGRTTGIILYEFSVSKSGDVVDIKRHRDKLIRKPYFYYSHADITSIIKKQF